jgi:RND family efflux transporter MFP subunit
MKRYLVALLIPVAMMANKPKASLVTTKPISEGVVNELQKFVGTTAFNRASEVASASSGVVTKVLFDDGDIVKKNQELVELDMDLIDSEIASLKATLAQSKLELEQAQMDLVRYENLIKSGSIVQKSYDDQKFVVAKYKQKLLSNVANLKAKEIQKDKKIIKAPFDGIVTSKSIEIGEWASSGKVVANIVDTSVVDLEFNVPASFLSYINKNQSFNVNISGHEANAKVVAIIPKGDVATRTFPLKLRVDTNMRVFEGMQTSINLASQKEKKSLTVPRDSVIKKFGQNVIFVNMDGKAKMIPVKVIGYTKESVAIEAKGIKKGMPVVVKGNERIFPNSPIKPMQK